MRQLGGSLIPLFTIMPPDDPSQSIARVEGISIESVEITPESAITHWFSKDERASDISPLPLYKGCEAYSLRD